MTASRFRRNLPVLKWRRRLVFTFAFTAVVLGWQSEALAYIDPNTSGILMQIIAPVLIALGVLRQRLMMALRLLAARIRRVIGHHDRD